MQHQPPSSTSMKSLRFINSPNVGYFPSSSIALGAGQSVCQALSITSDNICIIGVLYRAMPIFVHVRPTLKDGELDPVGFAR